MAAREHWSGGFYPEHAFSNSLPLLLPSPILPPHVSVSHPSPLSSCLPRLPVPVPVPVRTKRTQGAIEGLFLTHVKFYRTSQTTRWKRDSHCTCLAPCPVLPAASQGLNDGLRVCARCALLSRSAARHRAWARKFARAVRTFLRRCP